MNINKIITEEILLNEAVTDIAYHFTQINQLNQILEKNTIYLSPVLGQVSDLEINKGRFYALSLTSSRSTDIGYGASRSDNGLVRIVFNGRELNNNHKSVRIDYWNRPKDPNHPQYKTGSDLNPQQLRKQISRSDELEDRIISDKNQINNINKFIIQIDILISDQQRFRNEIILAKQLADRLNIPIYLYDNKKYFNANMKHKSISINMNKIDKNSDDYERNGIYDSFKILQYVIYRNSELESRIINDLKEKFGQELSNKFQSNLTDEINKIHYQIRFPDDFNIGEVTTSLTYTVSNNRSSTNELIRYSIMMLVNDMKKNNCKNIREYIIHKVWFGKMTQAKFNKQFNDKIIKLIDTTYINEINDLNTYSFETTDGEYYDSDFTKHVPEIKRLLDKKIYDLKQYCSNYILNNNDMFRYSYVLGTSNLKDVVNVSDIKLPNYIDDSRIGDYELQRVISSVIYEIDNFYYNEVKSMQEEYNTQFYK